MTKKPFNNNINSMNQLIQRDLGTYNLLDIKKLLNTYFDNIEYCNDNNLNLKTGVVVNIENFKFVTSYFLDCKNELEENNKRIQGTHIVTAKKLHCGILAIYPIISDTYSTIENYVFVIWDYDAIKQVGGRKNSGIKIRLNELCQAAYNKVPENLDATVRPLKYAKGAKFFSPKQLHEYLLNDKQLSKDIKHITDKQKTQDISFEDARTLIESYVRNSKTQKDFRKKILSSRECCCQLCSIKKEELLIASHIFPVKAIFDTISSNTKRVKVISDPSNGLLLCPTHDKLFDSGYISFSNSGKIIISKEITNIMCSLHVNKDMRIDTTFNTKYMQYHRKNIYIK